MSLRSLQFHHIPTTLKFNISAATLIERRAGLAQENQFYINRKIIN